MDVAKVTSAYGSLTSEARTSEVAWVPPGWSPVHDLVDHRLQDMTGLNDPEHNQMSRYCLSGEFMTHIDFIIENFEFEYNRIATLLLYLNEVKRGGNTVFTKWNISVPPIKNSAVFWFNELKNGDRDKTSAHSGCPVLQGEKWAEDCFNVAKMYIKQDLYSYSVEWLNQALMKINNGDRTSSRELVLHHLLPTLCATGNLKRSNIVYMELFEELPLPNLPPLEVARVQGEIPIDGCQKVAEIITGIQKEKMLSKLGREHLETHGRLCRGEGRVDDRLRCRYVHHGKPHLRLQPFKLEELQLDPPVVRFHQVISDLEAEALINFVSGSMYVPKLKSRNGLVRSNYRTSELALIEEGESPVNDRIERRLGDMTGLNAVGTEASEKSKISRYCLSGEFLTHVDYYAKSEDSEIESDRIATLLLYLKEVKRGGNTVFPTWNISAPPEKNSAVLWFNHLRNGVADETSEHSGCPVLQGQKWVMAKWFLDGGNMFKTPCGLQENDSFVGFFNS